MKNTFLIIISFFAAVAGFSQAPSSFNYQAVVRNSSGQPVASGPVSFRFTIREGTPTGTVLYQETQNKTTNSGGLVNCFVGTGNTVTGAYPTTAQWGSGYKYFQVEVDPAGGTSYTDMGTTQLMSVPLANFANGSGTANALSGTASITPAQISSGGAASGQILKWNGTAWAPVNETTSSGDITDVIAGTGMSGGGTSGSVTLNAQNTTALWNASQLQGQGIATSAPSTGQVLQYNGTAWSPATLSGSGGIVGVTAGTGLSGGGTSGTVTLNAQNSSALWNASQLQGQNIASSTPSNGQVLQYNSGTWSPATLSSGGITGVTVGTGLTGGGTSGNVSVSAQNTTALWNANMLQGFNVSSGTPTAGKVLKYNGTTWIAADDSTAVYKAGTGMTLSGNTFNSKWTTSAGGNDLYNNNTGHVSINSDTALARLYVKNSTIRSAFLPGTSYPHRASIFGYSDTADMGYYLTSAGVLGFGKGGYTSAGISGVSGGNGYFDLGLYSQSKVIGPSTARNYGIYNDVRSSNIFGIGIFNNIVARTQVTNGIYGSYNTVSGPASAVALGGYFECDPNNSSYANYGVYAFADSGGVNYAGYFDGDVEISGNLAKSSGTFKIDHPQDPDNKYLIHSFVESPDMMNVYNGNITTDENGFATVSLPSYFEAENIDFKYQLTVIGVFAQAIVKEEIFENQFIIQTSQPGVKVSWQVTGVRNDKWAQEHRIVPEVEKAEAHKGKYLTPELYGKPRSQGIHYLETKDIAIPEKP